MTASACPTPPPLDVDVAVVGSGAAGLSAALTAAQHGRKVAVFEKAPRLGGTTAWCSGWMWIPGSPVGPFNDDDPASARRYLQAELGPEIFDRQRDKIDAFLARGAAMVGFFQHHFAGLMSFEKDTRTPDFHAHPDQHRGLRMVRVPAFDGRRLGADLYRLRDPLPEFTLGGMAIEAGKDLDALLISTGPLNALSTLRIGLYVRSLLRAGYRGLSHVKDLLIHGRGMRLVNGHALVARLLACALELEGRARRQAGLPPAADDFLRLKLFTDHTALTLTRDADGRLLLTLDTPGGPRVVRARERVILACGGFPHDMRRIHQLFPADITYAAHRSAAPPENTGDGLRLAESLGAQVTPTFDAPAAFVPVSVRRRRDGSQAVYPHFVERAKPGCIAVQRDGRRFCDEAAAYHDVVRDWLAASPAGEAPRAWLICDYAFLVRFGLGMVKPLSVLPLWSIARGYLKVGWTVSGLAQRCGIDPGALCQQIERHNQGAPAADPQFRRGASAYDQSQGDPLAIANPCLRPIRGGPYFAVQLQVGSLGTLAGLRTNQHAQVLDEDGQVIPGLYACGNDMAAVMGGKYPTNGVTLASAMTFGHIAASPLPPDPAA